MARKKRESKALVTKELVDDLPTGEEEYTKEYHMWVTINNNSTGNISIEIKQFGKPGNGNPPPN